MRNHGLNESVGIWTGEVSRSTTLSLWHTTHTCLSVDFLRMLERVSPWWTAQPSCISSRYNYRPGAITGRVGTTYWPVSLVDASIITFGEDAQTSTSFKLYHKFYHVGHVMLLCQKFAFISEVIRVYSSKFVQYMKSLQHC